MASTTQGADGRHAAVLEQVVREHLESGQPVGSAAVVRSGNIGLGAASVRRIMAELEERGLLTHPHTSAGRVPTDLGYRAYVDGLDVNGRALPPGRAAELERTLADCAPDLADLLEVTSRLLSRESRQVGLVVGPDITQVALERIEFIPVAAHRVAAVVVGRSGAVHNRVLSVDVPIPAGELERIGRFLSAEYAGRTLPGILTALRRRHVEERATFDRLQAAGLALCAKAVEAEAEVGQDTVFVEGASNLLDSPEFSDLDVVRELFRTLEEKARLIDLLGRLVEGQGVQVMIGEENPLAGLSSCAVIASPYGAGARKLGTIGVVGPRRMPYGRVIALVDHLARSLTDVLSEPEN